MNVIPSIHLKQGLCYIMPLRAINVFLLILSFFFFVPVSGVFAFQGGNETTFQLSVGVAKKNITPDPKIKNWVTGQPYVEVLDSIYVRVLILNDGSKDIVIVAWDLVDAGESATAEVRKGISSELNIPKDHIVVSASHNHSAPWSPVYSGGYRGDERDTWWAIRYMPPQNDEPFFQEWMDQLIDQTVKTAAKAYNSMQPATLWIGRTDVSEYLNNRRPRLPAWGMEEKSNVPNRYNYLHEAWNPDVVINGGTFGPMDRAMTLISFRDQAGNNIVSVFHLAAHAVSIYPFTEGISSDWPGEACKQIKEALGGEAVFLQGAAGDINPWRRGREAVNEMGLGLAEHAKAAYKYSARLKTDTMHAIRGTVALPLTVKGKERIGFATVTAEVQVITLGPLALVTLPGEPLTDLGTAIRKRSPFPQTLLLGYANGNGVHYVSMPGEKARGGYEMERGTIGTDEAGQILVELAVQLLHKAQNR